MVSDFTKIGNFYEGKLLIYRVKKNREWEKTLSWLVISQNPDLFLTSTKTKSADKYHSQACVGPWPLQHLYRAGKRINNKNKKL